jgi:hypothetical protein
MRDQKAADAQLVTEQGLGSTRRATAILRRNANQPISDSREPTSSPSTALLRSATRVDEPSASPSLAASTLQVDPEQETDMTPTHMIPQSSSQSDASDSFEDNGARDSSSENKFKAQEEENQQQAKGAVQDHNDLNKPPPASPTPEQLTLNSAEKCTLLLDILLKFADDSSDDPLEWAAQTRATRQCKPDRHLRSVLLHLLAKACREYYTVTVLFKDADPHHDYTFPGQHSHETNQQFLARAQERGDHFLFASLRAPAAVLQHRTDRSHIPCGSMSTIRIDVGAHDVPTHVSNTRIGVVAYVQNRP